MTAQDNNLPQPMAKVTLRLFKADYEYLRHMAEMKFESGGLNMIIREILASYVLNVRQLEEKHRLQNSPHIPPRSTHL